MTKKVKYPENLYLKQRVLDSGITIRHLSKKIGISTVVLSQIINGHYKGNNIVPKLLQEITFGAHYNPIIQEPNSFKK